MIGIVIATMALAALTGPAFGQRAVLAMLDHLQSGRWEVRARDDGRVEKICLPNDHRLIQLRHPGVPCERLIVGDTASEVTVQYTCRGRGYGRTHIRRETDQLVQIDTQGIVDGLPFAYAAEARRVADCGG